MKTKFKFLALTAVTLVLGFSSCSNDNDDVVIDHGPQKVLVKITQDTSSTRTIGPAQENDKAVAFNGGMLYMVDRSGVIKESYEIGVVPENPDPNVKIISLSDLITKGVTIANVDGSVERIAIVGNTDMPKDLITLRAVETEVLEIVSQKDLNKVNLYGHAALSEGQSTTIPADRDSPLLKTCVINLNPTVGRVELTDITSNSSVKSFKVQGVFVDRFYAEAVVGGQVSDVSYANGGDDSNKFNIGTEIYTEELKTVVYDWNQEGLPSSLVGTSQVVAAGSGQVWGYNLFSYSSPITGESTTGVPSIVIRLTDVVTSDGLALQGSQFITVRSFTLGDDEITVLNPGEVLHVPAGALTFDIENVADAPNVKPISVQATVKLANWVVKDVGTTLN